MEFVICCQKLFKLYSLKKNSLNGQIWVKDLLVTVDRGSHSISDFHRFSLIFIDSQIDFCFRAIVKRKKENYAFLSFNCCSLYVKTVFYCCSRIHYASITCWLCIRPFCVSCMSYTPVTYVSCLSCGSVLF